MPNISVVMPVYNSERYIAEAIESVISQTYEDWELLVINEYGSNRQCAERVKKYQDRDSRIKLLQNERRLGLADSLNRGIREAQGKYVARLDADDLAHPSRFEKQIKFLEENKDVILCGTYQHHFGPEIDWVHKPAVSPEQCKANLLFFCDICHSTLMFRKDVFIINNLFYDSQFQAEDFELWTRVASVGNIANIPEVLGEYRWGEENITVEKMAKLQKESGRIVAKTLFNNLQMKLTEEETQLFDNWVNLYQEKGNRKQKENRLNQLEKILRRIYEVNKDKKYYDDQALLNALGAKWRWAKYCFPFNQIEPVEEIDDVFKARMSIPIINKIYFFIINNKGIKVKARKIMKKLKFRK